MNPIIEISSIHNPLVKKVLLLKEKSRERKKECKFVFEGQRELQLAIKGEYEIETLLFYDAIISKANVLNCIQGLRKQPKLISVSKEVYHKIAYRETTEGILAIAKPKPHQLEKLKFKTNNPLILVVESPEKPGNIGAILRTADAANIDAVIIANLKGDLYNPNTIRSSVGCIFTNSIALASTSEVINFLKNKNINIYCAALSASKIYTEINFTLPTALVMGTEATGLTQEWLQNSTQNIIIPMRGEIDSMNVSVSAAILIFEASRQRGF